MSKFNHFLDLHELESKDVIFVPYGSQVYGTARKGSDEDYMAIVPKDRKTDTGHEYDHDGVNIHVYNREDFQNQLNQHKIHALEGWFHPDELLSCNFQLKLQLSILRHSIASKASHSSVKAKKKIEVEKDYLAGWKSLFHSLRILIFGTQIAEHGKITNFGAANKYWWHLINEKQVDWNVLKERYQPVYNELATEFRKHAPKLARSHKWATSS